MEVRAGKCAWSYFQWTGYCGFGMVDMEMLLFAQFSGIRSSQNNNFNLTHSCNIVIVLMPMQFGS